MSFTATMFFDGVQPRILQSGVRHDIVRFKSPSIILYTPPQTASKKIPYTSLLTAYAGQSRFSNYLCRCRYIKSQIMNISVPTLRDPGPIIRLRQGQTAIPGFH